MTQLLSPSINLFPSTFRVSYILVGAVMIMSLLLSSLVSNVTSYKKKTQDGRLQKSKAPISNIESQIRPFINTSEIIEQPKTYSKVANERPYDANSTSGDAPRVAWLLSFPNSGTSYTLTNVQRITQKSVASNYARQWSTVQSVGQTTNDFQMMQLGPFYKGHLPLPSTYVLTKTHCTGFCDNCDPAGFIVPTSSDFELKCRQSERDENSNDSNHTGILQEKRVIRQIYPTPTRAVHLIRHPLDNLVSRMHHALKKWNKTILPKQDQNLNTTNNKKERKNEFEELYSIANLPTERKRLIAWCNYTDRVLSTWLQRMDTISLDVKRKIQATPRCGVELFRYVQWHTRALEMTIRNAGRMKVHYLYYESYTSNYDVTVRNLLDFLELPQTQKQEPFVGNKTYFNTLFTRHERKKAAELIRYIATDESYRLLEQYFRDE